MKYANMWIDGICKDCGWFIIETGSNADKDYKNMCTNPDCKNHVWHDVYDIETADYYLIHSSERGHISNIFGDLI